MVPMALLTEAIISYLSSELQTSDQDVRQGILAAHAQKLLDPATSCEQLRRAGIEELLVGDIDPISKNEVIFQKSGARYFLIGVQPGDKEGFQPANLLRGESDNTSLNLSNMLSADSCAPSNAKYKPPVFSSYSSCPVEAAGMLSRTSAEWRWKWIDDPVEINTKRDYIYCDYGLLLERK